MVIVNFLPWRDYQSKYQIKVLKTILLVFIALSLSSVFLTHIILAKKISSLTNEVKALQELQKVLPKPSLSNLHPEVALLSNQFMSNLTIYNIATNKLFLNLSGKQSVCFTKIIRNKNQITFFGRTTSPLDFTEFMKDWPASPLFSLMFVNQLQQKNRHLFTFHFTATQTTSFSINQIQNFE